MKKDPFIITSKRVLISGDLQPAGILVEGEQIKEILTTGSFPDSVPVVDYGNLVIMPGLIDPHVHVNEPGRTDWEGFETATKAAAAGGITTIADMPLNSSPVTTTAEALAIKRNAAAGKTYVDFTFYGGLVPGNESEIGKLLDGGVSGIKTFLCHSGIDDFPNSTEEELRKVMPLLADRKIPLLVHAELPDGNTPQISDPDSYREYLVSRPQNWETDAIKLLIKLCRETGCHVHIVHLSASTALPLLENARNEGLPLTVETAPHYLYFEAEKIADADTRFKCAPPIRNSENRQALWKALKGGLIDFVATDHSPSPPSMKKGSLHSAWGGISSLQLLLPVFWTAGLAEDVTIAQISRWTSTGAVRFLGLENSCGDILPGKNASFVVWNPDEAFKVNAASLFHRHKMTPYDGETLYGKVIETWLRGKKIYSNCNVSDKPYGKEIIKS